MECVKILTNDHGQSVQLPEDSPWRSMLKGLSMFTDDCLAEEIEDPPPQERPGLWD